MHYGFCDPAVLRPKGYAPVIVKVGLLYGAEIHEGYMTDGGLWYVPVLGPKPVEVLGWCYWPREGKEEQKHERKSNRR